ncbi:MAG: DUF359 domain-containing protein [Candidatus Micrarchaeota archaeon]|nr:DUF359 domain-containing protein [Candidatus Micrarchaeota archaeon]
MGRHILPEAMREEMRRPLGRVMEIDDAVELARQAEGAVCVGDVCASEIIAAGVLPHVSVYDRKTVRKSADEKWVSTIESAYNICYSVKNPHATITDEAALALRLAIGAHQPSRVLVDGEEDLLALIAMIECPDGWVVFYGMPGEGIVAAVVGAELHRKAKALLKRMVREE